MWFPQKSFLHLPDPRLWPAPQFGWISFWTLYHYFPSQHLPQLRINDYLRNYLYRICLPHWAESSVKARVSLSFFLFPEDLNSASLRARLRHLRGTTTSRICVPGAKTIHMWMESQRTTFGCLDFSKVKFCCFVGNQHGTPSSYQGLWSLTW